ncbi:beta-1,3-galactosyltransferase 2 [Silurus meridionalis]|uniref:beta-1,3-galactosyltransferase 2 n=1 Tax=Silurus meridionalis TaxID=175797 RepID=UPI001EEA74FE|nr:beta-1,3-galactosyltransferase 2 [Silurus meridionalis]XP_046708390.1 beta-1,3-galactosyltransferase 2 [Silurus meridionalis]XP_046708391.1 beta-1,3-galactosyltransferase 2 [Silurus meridionalis]KAI5103784.1 beta-1,3-galactosyltransferase 2 [Silurus meridionalis]
MQCRRRHCFTRIVASLVALLVGLVIIRQFYRPTRQNGQVTSFHQELYKVLRQKDFAEPLSPTRSLANGSLVSVQPASRTLPRSNRSLAKEENAESVRKVEPYRYILNEPDKCKRNDTFLLLLIPVEPHNVNARSAIRQTWGNESLGKGIVRLFLMGVKNGMSEHSLRSESVQHRDMIQQEYIDSYYNLTIKTLMGMHWVSRFCPKAKYIMKADSDMFVNTEYLVEKLLKSNIPTKMYFTGYLMRGYKPNRNKNSKWYMSSELYPSESYPTFCSGTGYVFSADMAERIYNTSLSIRRLHLEDVYVGLCLAKLNIEPILPPNEFLFNHWKVSYSSCKYSQLITSHEFRPSELIKYWQHLQMNKDNACKLAKG